MLERKMFYKGERVRMLEPVDELCRVCSHDCVMRGGKGIITIKKDCNFVHIKDVRCYSAVWDSDFFEVVPEYNWRKL